MRVTITDLSLADHLHAVLDAGSKTPEFAVGENTLFWSADVLTSWRRLEGGPMLVALDSHRAVVGFLLSTFQRTGIATIENIRVAHYTRGRGVASALIDEFERRACSAGMGLARSFGHVSNVAVSRLLTKRGYQDAGITWWCSGSPHAMVPSRETLSREAMETRLVPPSNVDAAWLADCIDSGLASGAVRGLGMTDIERLLTSADMVHGAFSEQRLVGLAVASAHEPTGKGTIESIVTAQATVESFVVESLVRSVVRDAAEQGIRYLTAHPVTAAAVLVETLVASGFVKQRCFRLQSKAM